MEGFAFHYKIKAFIYWIFMTNHLFQWVHLLICWLLITHITCLVNFFFLRTISNTCKSKESNKWTSLYPPTNLNIYLPITLRGSFWMVDNISQWFWGLCMGFKIISLTTALSWVQLLSPSYTYGIRCQAL
jgi:hypothetical protein